MAGLLIGLCLLGEVSNLSHLLLVRHVTCAEHGQLVDVGEEAGAHELSVPLHETTGSGLRASVEAEGSHQGHHCQVLVALRTRVSPRVTSTGPVEIALALGVTVAPAEGVSSPYALILLAPKASPPV